MRPRRRSLWAAALLSLLPSGCGPDQPPPAERPSPAAQAAAARASRRDFEDAITSLIDELSVKDPLLLSRIRAEQRRIRALPSREAQSAAVRGAYPILERALERSAARGRLSPEGAAKWKVFRAQVQKAIAEGTLLERALFAGKAFEDKVQGLLGRGTTMLDPDRKLPEEKDAYMTLSQWIHGELKVPRNSTALKPPQIDRAFELAGEALGIRPEFLKYMAKTESGLRQSVPSNPAAAGIMQIEKVHKAAFLGAWNVANDTITNIVYGALLRAQVDREMARRFEDAGIAPPSSARVVEFLGDLAYNRGTALLKHVAKHAAEQKIDVNDFGEYLGGPGGGYTLVDDAKRIVVTPGPGTRIDRTGRNSVLELSSRDIGRVLFSRKLAAGLGDRNGDARVDHLDVWLTRGVRYLDDASLAVP
ncbi:MAG: transglycosylase SLT domain-containing protein [Elusimicrobiota bacterium]